MMYEWFCLDVHYLGVLKVLANGAFLHYIDVTFTDEAYEVHPSPVS